MTDQNFKKTSQPAQSPSRRKGKPRHNKTTSPQKSGLQSEKGGNASAQEPLFFYREQEKFGWFCQWYACTFTDPEDRDQKVFNCAEQYMMYHKAMTFGDENIAAQIMNTTSPERQKGLAKTISSFDEERWREVRMQIVEKGNYLKFTQGMTEASKKEGPVLLKSKLLSTKGRELVEASRADRIWGIGYDAQHALKVSREDWGENLLGKCLMSVREKLLREEGEMQGNRECWEGSSSMRQEHEVLTVS